jgi:phage/plasmid-like protein (TIGR03299 family)
MSQETSKWLNTNTLVGFTDKRGNAWHYRGEDQGEQSNHYPDAIPVGDVERRLFHWDAISAPVQATIYGPKGEEIVITDESRQVVVRPDTQDILGVFREGYQIHQYSEWLLDNVAILLDDDLAIGSAGLLERGGMAWVQVEMPDNIETPEGETFRASLLACTSHNGKLASTFTRAMTRIVCDNTLDAGLREGNTSTASTVISKSVTLAMRCKSFTAPLTIS